MGHSWWSQLAPDAREHGLEDAQAVVGPEQLVHRAFRVGHHAEHIAGLVDDSGNRAHRAVGAPELLAVARTADVAEDDASFALEAIERFLISGVAAVAVGDGD